MSARRQRQMCIRDRFVVELLEKLVEQSDNELDDRALQIVKKGLDIK